MRVMPQGDRQNQDLGGAMTDISFLLIVFFLVTAVFVTEEGISSSLPESDSTPKLESVDNVVQIAMNSQTSFEVNSKNFTSLEEVKEFITSIVENRKDMVAIVEVKENIVYNSVVTFLSTVKEAGISEITIYSNMDSSKDFLVPLTVPALAK